VFTEECMGFQTVHPTHLEASQSISRLEALDNEEKVKRNADVSSHHKLVDQIADHVRKILR
jgi:hypothetical protein